MNKQKTLLSIYISIIGILITTGLVFIYSSSSVYALEKFGASNYFVKKQLIGLIIGLTGLLIAFLFPIKIIKKYSPILFLLSLFLTSLTLVKGIGTTINGSSRWISLFGFNIQPSELLKISFILYLSYFLDKKKYQLNSFTKTFIPFLCIIGISSFILLMQPDFGQMITLSTTAFILFFVAGGSIKNILITLVPAILGIIYLITTKAYRLKRILIFLNPWKDPEGAGFQIIQSLIAIGSGKLIGLGITNSKQKFFYLPMQHNDFIFSIIAEETGFIGSTILIILYILFMFFGIKLAMTLKNNFSKLLTIGFTTLISLQAIINIYVATGLAPTKGIGLPFVSYGNSHLISALLLLGIIINCIYSSEKLDNL